jgi:FlaA1/EpsC-like NDP-sugar epimerase
MYGAVKRELANILHGFYREGIRTVVLFGAAETAEVVHAALKDTALVMIGVVDSDASKHGRPFNGLIIQPPEKLQEIQPDAVIITSFGKQEEIYEVVRKVVGDYRIAIKKLSDI